MNLKSTNWVRIALGVGTAGLVLLAFALGRMGGRSPNDGSLQSATGAETASNGAAQEYTCSMHPHFRSTDPNDKCPICGMDLIPVPSDGDDQDRNLPLLRLSPRAIALMNIQTWPVERRAVEVPLRLYGRIEYDETRLRTIAAWAPGRLDQLFVDSTGVQVRQGDPLVKLYSPRLIQDQQALLQALRGAQDLQGSGVGIIRETSQATLEAARERLRLLGLSPAQIERIETEGTVFDHLTIHSPVSGIVTERRATEGAYVETGETIYRVADLSRLWVNLEVYESDLAWLSLGQEAVFTAEAFPGEEFQGQVSFINPILDDRTRTVRARVEVPNPEGRLRPGMFVRGSVRAQAGYQKPMPPPLEPFHEHPPLLEPAPALDLDAAEAAPASHGHNGHAEPAPGLTESEAGELPLVIPASAPLITGKRAVVYVRLPGTERPTFEGREVVLGARAGEYYIVRDGLAEGELVVTHGNFKIDSELQIRGRPSMMAPEGGMPAGHDHGHGPELSGSRAGRPEAIPVQVPAAFQKSLGLVFHEYFAAQQALAGDDLPAFRAASQNMHAAIESIDAAELSPEAGAVWAELAPDLLAGQGHIGHLTEIKEARKLFQTHSEAAIQLALRFGHGTEEEVRLVFCPMVFDNAGGQWLQTGDKIANPYAGAVMLRCGDVLDQIEPVPASPAGLPAQPATSPAGAGDISSVPPEFVQALEEVYQGYFEMKTALAEDDLARFSAAVPHYQEAVASIESASLESESGRVWDGLAKRLLTDADQAASLEEIEEARAIFETWAKAAIETTRIFGHANPDGHFIASCPMAFDWRGADWLQSSAEINNPYFGASMLRCGLVKDQLAPSINGEPGR